jgi:radical SAM family uncharacterized protein/radical SAM-linked protein
MGELAKTLEREILPLVARPGRYTGGERNVRRKDPDDCELKFLLAFPDVYEIGMSHLGIRVLYDILNRRPDVAAERCFAPWTDMEKLMREKGVPLFSVESTRPAGRFDIVGFTLQYELHYSNVLNMLDLAGIPLRAADRGEDDPLVVGGGPSALNPEPVACFFDALVVGDGEGAVLDLADLVLEARGKGLSRRVMLGRAAGIPGVYVPSLYEPRFEHGSFVGTRPVDEVAPETVSRRVEPELTYDGHPAVPIVPVMETTHDRLSIEIMRGCTRGCRFCQPGMITRPVRSRPVADVERLVEEGLAGSGYDEVSLVSLSTLDYDGLPELVACLNERLFDKRVSISLPSLRVDRFGLELADSIGRVRRAGLTFAPEAGTQRLRDVINKNETEEHILETVDVAFASGWNRIKLYFMIGLPTETREDLEGIVDLVSKVRRAARARKKGARINVSISPFVPRAHTPFQWERQDSPEEISAKENFLRDRIRGLKGVKLSTRDPNVSFLEGVMSRGDRSLCDVVEGAWRRGVRFDGWTETFDFSLWEEAFAEAEIEPLELLGPLGEDAVLPWAHIEGGPSAEFLAAEREKALRGEATPDCREVGCFDCGACQDASLAGASRIPSRDGARGTPKKEERPYGRRERKARKQNDAGTRWRVRYRKGTGLRFVSHLDVVRAILRALSMSGLPIVYTQGFNPHPKLSFGPPLPVGSTGEAEFFDLELTRAAGASEVEDRLGAGLPEGLSILSVSAPASRLSASAVAEAAEYLIGDADWLDELDREELLARMEALRRTEEVEVPKGDGVRAARPRDSILELGVVEDSPLVLRAVLAVGKKGALRPVDLVRLLDPSRGDRAGLARIHRTGLLRRPASGLPGLEPIL